MNCGVFQHKLDYNCFICSGGQTLSNASTNKHMCVHWVFFPCIVGVTQCSDIILQPHIYRRFDKMFDLISPHQIRNTFYQIKNTFQAVHILLKIMVHWYSAAITCLWANHLTRHHHSSRKAWLPADHHFYSLVESYLPAFTKKQTWNLSGPSGPAVL